MAYGKYIVGSINGYNVEIWRKNWTAEEARPKALSVDGLKLRFIDGDFDKSISKTTVDITFYDDEFRSYYNDFFTASATKFKLLIYQGDQAIWSGYITPDSYSFSDNVPVTITARDNLGYLDQIDFDMSGMNTIDEILLEAQNKISWQADAWEWVGAYTAENGAYNYGDAEINCDYFEGTWLEMIEALLVGFQLRYVGNNTWNIFEVTKLEQISAREYSINEGGASYSVIPSWRTTTIKQNYGVKETIFSFEQNENDFEYVGYDTIDIKVPSFGGGTETATFNRPNLYTNSNFNGYVLDNTSYDNTKNTSSNYYNSVIAGLSGLVYRYGYDDSEGYFTSKVKIDQTFSPKDHPLCLSWDMGSGKDLGLKITLNAFRYPIGRHRERGAALNSLIPMFSIVGGEVRGGKILLAPATTTLKVTVKYQTPNNTYYLNNGWQTDPHTIIFEYSNDLAVQEAASFDEYETISREINIVSMPDIAGKLIVEIQAYHEMYERPLNDNDDTWDFEKAVEIAAIAFKNISVEPQTQTSGLSLLGAINESGNIKETKDIIYSEVPNNQGGSAIFTSGLFHNNEPLKNWQRSDEKGGILNLAENIARAYAHLSNAFYQEGETTGGIMVSTSLMQFKPSNIIINGKKYALTNYTWILPSNKGVNIIAREIRPYEHSTNTYTTNAIASGRGVVSKTGDNELLIWGTEGTIMPETKRIYELGDESDTQDSYIIIDRKGNNAAKRYLFSNLLTKFGGAISGALKIGETLTVYGKSVFKALATFTNIEVNNDANVNGDFTTIGNTSLKGDVTIGGDTTVSGNTTLNGDVTVGGTLQSPNHSTSGIDTLGYGVSTDENGISTLSIGRVVADEFKVDVLTHNQINVVGGTMLLSKVWADITRAEVADNGAPTFYYKPKYGGQVWQIGDQPRMAKSGRNFWGVITSVSSEANADGEYSFTCSSLAANIRGSVSDPRPGDTFALYGSRGSNRSRKSIMVWSSGADEDDVPSIKNYFGIDSFDLTNLESKTSLSIGYDTTLGVYGARIKLKTDTKEIYLLGENVYTQRDEASEPKPIVQEMGLHVQGETYFANQRVTLPKGTMYLCKAADGTTEYPNPTSDNWLLQSTDYDTEIEAAKQIGQTAQQSVSTLITDLQDLDSDVNTTIKDGIVESGEKSIVKAQLKVLQDSYSTLMSSYNAVKANVVLSGTSQLTTLEQCATSMETCYSTLVSSIEAILAADKTTALLTQDYDVAFSGYSAATSLCSTALEEAVAYISRAEAQGAVDSQKIGSVNLLDNSGDERSVVNANVYESYIYYNAVDYIAGETYTIGFYAKSTIDNAKCDCFFAEIDGYNRGFITTTEYKYYEFQMKIPDNFVFNNKRQRFDANNTNNATYTLYIKGAKLVKGNKITEDWQPSLNDQKGWSEDVQNKLNNLSQSVDATNTEIRTAITDGDVDATDKAKILGGKDAFADSYNSLIASYNELYTNTYLSGTEALSNLTTSKNTLFAKYTDLCNAINGVANATHETLESKVSTYAAAFGAYNTASNGFNTALSAVNKAIADGAVGIIDWSERNLLKNSNNGGSGWSNANYPTAIMHLGDYKPSEGEEVTVVIKGDLGDGTKNFFSLFNSGDMHPIYGVHRSKFIDGVARATFNWSIGGTANDRIHLFGAPNDGSISSIEWVKLVKGNNTSKMWTEAIEDVSSKIATADAKGQAYLDELSDYDNDGKITPSEKVDYRGRWKAIVAEKPGYEALADSYSVPHTDYTNAYDALHIHINTGSGILTDMATTSSVTAGSVDAYFNDYYSKLSALTKAVQVKIDANTQATVDNIETGANNLLSNTNSASFAVVSGYVHSETFEGCLVYGSVTPNGYRDIAGSINIGSTKAGQTYTYSFWAKGTSMSCFFYNINSAAKMQGSQGQSGYSVDGWITFTLTDDWAFYWVKWTEVVDCAYKNIIPIRVGGANTAYISQPMFIKGNTPAKWNNNNDLIADIDNRPYDGINLLIKKDATKGVWLNSAGVIGNSNDWGTTDYIAVPSGVKSLTASGAKNYGVSAATCYYDASKNFVTGKPHNSVNSSDAYDYHEDIPSNNNIAYMRFTFVAEYLDETKIEWGKVSTAFTKNPVDVEADAIQESPKMLFGGNISKDEFDGVLEEWDGEPLLKTTLDSGRVLSLFNNAYIRNLKSENIDTDSLVTRILETKAPEGSKHITAAGNTLVAYDYDGNAGYVLTGDTYNSLDEMLGGDSGFADIVSSQIDLDLNQTKHVTHTASNFSGELDNGAGSYTSVIEDSVVVGSFTIPSTGVYRVTVPAMDIQCSALSSINLAAQGYVSYASVATHTECVLEVGLRNPYDNDTKYYSTQVVCEIQPYDVWFEDSSTLTASDSKSTGIKAGQQRVVEVYDSGEYEVYYSYTMRMTTDVQFGSDSELSNVSLSAAYTNNVQASCDDEIECVEVTKVSKYCANGRILKASSDMYEYTLLKEEYGANEAFWGVKCGDYGISLSLSGFAFNNMALTRTLNIVPTAANQVFSLPSGGGAERVVMVYNNSDYTNARLAPPDGSSLYWSGSTAATAQAIMEARTLYTCTYVGGKWIIKK